MKETLMDMETMSGNSFAFFQSSQWTRVPGENEIGEDMRESARKEKEKIFSRETLTAS